jgi:lipid-binding SYLF domain-containing protein
MKAKIGVLVAAVLGFMLSGLTVPAYADESKKVREAATVIKEIMDIPENGVPPALFNDAAGIAVIPGVIKLGFIVGGRYGTGVLVVRGKAGNWSPPAFVSLAGGSFGWQIGAQSSDIILVFKNRRSIDGIMSGKFTLGADAAVAAGPVGRDMEASTDVKLKAEIYSYSRSRGLFAGISLEGAALQIDDEADAAFYGRPEITAGEILFGKFANSSNEVRNLLELLTKYASEKLSAL